MRIIKKSPWAFIILIGVVSLFSDMTHEGTRAITGPFLAMLGASATVVGFVAGFADYPLIAFHFSKTSQVSTEMIPVMYAIAMGVDVLAALLLGWWFDKQGIKVLIASTLVLLLFAPLVFIVE